MGEVIESPRAYHVIVVATLKNSIEAGDLELNYLHYYYYKWVEIKYQSENRTRK
jgi:hypothetical protein